MVSIPNSLLAGGLCLYLKDQFQVVSQTEQTQVRTTCLAHQADILLVEARDYEPLKVANWISIYHETLSQLPKCKLILIVDENTSPQASIEVKEAKKKGLIDTFFFSSVSGEYLSAVIESLS